MTTRLYLKALERTLFSCKMNMGLHARSRWWTQCFCALEVSVSCLLSFTPVMPIANQLKAGAHVYWILFVTVLTSWATARVGVTLSRWPAKKLHFGGGRSGTT
jgi:hypothetical protein